MNVFCCVDNKCLLIISILLIKGLRPRNTHCVTAPCGDKSLSYIHTLQIPSIEPQTLRQHEEQQVIQLNTIEGICSPTGLACDCWMHTYQY